VCVCGVCMCVRAHDGMGLYGMEYRRCVCGRGGW
jgi:hypothetical protein